MRACKLINFNVWPVAQRELRDGARRRGNHWLRVGAAAAGTLLLWSVVADTDEPAATMGVWLFNCLHALLLWLIFLIVPAMTADCIAREKREGTLGLLFLTLLTAMGIVLGKGLVQALRALTLWLAVLPVLTIPFLMGGIGRTEVFRAIAIEFCATILCLAAGLLASSLTKSRGAAFLLALVFGVNFVNLLAMFLFGCLVWQGYLPWRYGLLGAVWAVGLLPLPSNAVGWLIGSPVIPAAFWHWILAAGILLSLLLFLVVARFSAWRIERSWQDKSPSPQQEYLLKKYCTPLFQRWFSRRMGRCLDRNPIAWLQEYSWKARLVKWGFCLAFLLIECLAVTGDSGAFDMAQAFLLLILAAACTFVGVSSFLAEKRSGALELLLITPLSDNKIIVGRAWGLWKQFLPAALILAACDVGSLWISGELEFNRPAASRLYSILADYLPGRLTVACGFLALPFCATYFALRVKNLIVAAALAWVALLIPPFIAMSCCNGFEIEGNEARFCVLLLLSDLELVLLVCFLLRHSLSRRIYSF